MRQPACSHSTLMPWKSWALQSLRQRSHHYPLILPPADDRRAPRKRRASVLAVLAGSPAPRRGARRQSPRHLHLVSSCSAGACTAASPNEVSSCQQVGGCHGVSPAAVGGPGGEVASPRSQFSARAPRRHRRSRAAPGAAASHRQGGGRLLTVGSILNASRSGQAAAADNEARRRWGISVWSCLPGLH